MELRDYITSETTALVERLMAAAEAATQQTTLESQAAITQLRVEIDQAGAELQAATSRADSLAAQVDAETSRAELLAAKVDAETLRAEALTTKLDGEVARAATIAEQLEVETTRVAALTAQVEAAAARAAASEAGLEAETARAAALSASLETESNRAAALAASLETESNRAAALAAEIEASAGAIRMADGERLKAESALKSMTVELQTVREAFNVACADAAQASETIKGESAERVRLQEAHELAVRDLESRIEAAAAETSTLRASLADAEARTREALSASENEVRSLQGQLEHQAGMLRDAEAHVQSLTAQLEQQTGTVSAADARVAAAEAAVAKMREAAEEANAITDATSTALTAMRDHVKHVMAMWNGAASSIKDLSTANTTGDVFKTLVQQLSNQFERAAIFKVKERHLVGDLAAGLDASVDIKKIVIPIGMGSLITKAAIGTGVEHATAEQMAESRPPFGGTPSAALAGPLVFEGEVLAVVYADSDTAFTDAHAPYASVLIRHANAVLAGLAEELRIARQLHDYARTLLRDAETLFDADVKAGVPEHERVKRLGGSIRFARDLYAQRAALETSPSADILEDEIAEIVRAEAPSPFAAALGGAVRDRQAQTA